jgi:hypothetical protein
MGMAWSEIPGLLFLRLENCVFGGEDLGDILPRTTPRLQSLALFSVRGSFRENKIPASLAESLVALWIEDVWPLSFDTYFASYKALQVLHLDWHLFAKMVPYAPRNLIHVSITIPPYVARSAPNYDRFETEILHLSIDRPRLKTVNIRGQCGYRLLTHESLLRTKLGCRGVELIQEFVHRGEGKNSSGL